MIFAPDLPPLALWAAILGGIALIVLCVHQIRKAVGARRWQWALRLLLVLCCVLALLRPGIPGGSARVLATAADVFIVADTSASVAAEDWGDDGTRLQGMREDIAQIAKQYPGARFALLSFDAQTQVRLPLTTDSTALLTATQLLAPQLNGSSQGTSITEAHNVLQQLLQAAQRSGSDRARLVFYLGDGEHTASKPPASFADSANLISGGMVLGYGTKQGGKMRLNSLDPHAENAYLQYRGAPAISVIDPQQLQKIAKQLGVPYVQRSQPAALQLPPLSAASTQQLAGKTGMMRELYWIPVALATVLLIIELFFAAQGLHRAVRQSRSTPQTPEVA